jgi:glycosyltransferase involved in cell wall biosynthesis
MTSMPLISVIIPTFNQGSYLTGALESVLAQTYPNLEIIVVDHGSQDNTVQLVEPYWREVKYYFEGFKSKSAALNCGFREANGSWIAILNPCDRWHPEKLKLQLETAIFHSRQCGVCFTVQKPLASRGNLFKPQQRLGKEQGVIEQPLQYLLKPPHGILISSLLIKHSLLAEIDGTQESLCLHYDTDLLFRLALKSDFCYLNRSLVSIKGKLNRPRRLSRRGYANYVSRILADKQSMYESWLTHYSTHRPRIGEIIRHHLSKVHQSWAYWHLQNGHYDEALSCLARAAALRNSIFLTIKRLLLNLSPRTGAQLLLHNQLKLQTDSNNNPF